ncbi:mechanosensitive ion channel family protein [Pedobacter hiemivivus]|uniref:Mechanosensitive ion channel family protein n=2 Tax=Pedobacter hiemivivus TaxID=2530454 RepID=A0A4U1G6C5_9SPHI|nr:mechanosensitive ion channel family protein [Pedobacter hiemivivus]TKC58103.1 mechanosensitive ion channel family protein [Pedobacter hiemivivus]
MMMDNQFFEQIFWGNTVKQYCFFVGIILLGLLFKRLVSKLISHGLFKIFEKFAAEVNGDTFAALLLKPIESFISFCTIYLAVNHLTHPLDTVLWHRSKTKIEVTIGDCLDKVFLFLIILSIFWIILRIIDFIAFVLKHRAAITNNRTDDQLVPFLKELTKTLICFLGFFVLLGFVFEINVLTLITGLGIGGIAIALAAKESLENLIGSFTIFLDKPFTVGDVVKVDGIEGTIDKVGFRSTWLISPDKTTIVIPNRAMIDGVLENVTLRNYRRVNFFIGITYETDAADIKLIIKAIGDFLTAHPDTKDGYATFDNFGDFALHIQVVYLVNNMDHSKYLKVKEEVNFKLMEIVKQYRSDFAYPTQRSIGDTPK